jgi:aspartate/methionine/tyrosine aminotransferase
LGWLVVPEFAMDAANRLMQNLYIAAPTHSQYAALAAFEDDTQTILCARRDAFKQRRDVLYDGLKDLGFKLHHKPEGAFYIYADCSAHTHDSYAFALTLLEQQGVAITPGMDFGRNKSNEHVRFAYTTSLENIEIGLERIKIFLNNS